MEDSWGERGGAWSWDCSEGNTNSCKSLEACMNQGVEVHKYHASRLRMRMGERRGLLGGQDRRWGRVRGKIFVDACIKLSLLLVVNEYLNG